MNIVLIGMRGSGKTSVATMLSKKLSLPLYDTDRMLEMKVGMSLSDFVKNNGWDVFRVKETEIVEDLTNVTDAIISTGGGIILSKKNIETLHKHGTFIFLQTSIDTMAKRIKHSKVRPFLTDKKMLEEELVEVWDRRKELYIGNADIIVITDDKSLEEITKEIIQQL
jgi:shikimate kinase